jgi:hypothetical protein
MSRFDVLSKRATPARTQEEKTPGARRTNPGYRQFSAYIPTELYRRVKVRIAEQDLDLSEAVEHALDLWLKQASPD